jgi:septum formation topological specificity factor MinE
VSPILARKALPALLRVLETNRPNARDALTKSATQLLETVASEDAQQPSLLAQLQEDGLEVLCRFLRQNNSLRNIARTYLITCLAEGKDEEVRFRSFALRLSRFYS